jgi:hypothetical protein
LASTVTVLRLDDLVGLLDRFGMNVELDPDGAAHALVEVIEAHATQAEDATRRAGAGRTPRLSPKSP